jgi:hypothetical protein
MKAGLDISKGSAGFIVDMIDTPCIYSIITKNELDQTGVISGTAVLTSSLLEIEQSNGEIKLILPESASNKVKELPEDDRRHYKARRARRRALALQSGRDHGHRNLVSSTTGTLETLVVRVQANNGKQPALEMPLYEDIFSDSVCLKT